VNHLLKSVVREIRTLRSVGTGGGRPPPVTRWAPSNGRPYRHRQEKWSMPSSSGDQTRVGRTLTLGRGAESSMDAETSNSRSRRKTSVLRPMISARAARIDDNLGRGTDGSNPLPSSGESTTNCSGAGADSLARRRGDDPALSCFVRSAPSCASAPKRQRRLGPGHHFVSTLDASNAKGQSEGW
jgi:hypothetical protein